MKYDIIDLNKFQGKIKYARDFNAESHVYYWLIDSHPELIKELSFNWGLYYNSSTGTDGNQYYQKIFTILMKVDKETSDRLYGKFYNPVTITLTNAPGLCRNNNQQFKHMLICTLHSTDDTAFQFRCYIDSLERLKLVKGKLVNYIENTKTLNGDELIYFGLEELNAIDTCY